MIIKKNTIPSFTGAIEALNMIEVVEIIAHTAMFRKER